MPGCMANCAAARGGSWRHWKRGYNRMKELSKHGLDIERAIANAFNGQGLWRNVRASHTNAMLLGKYLRQEKLVFMLEIVQRNHMLADT